MNGILAIQSRVAELRSQLHTLAPAQAAAPASAASFANALESARSQAGQTQAAPPSSIVVGAGSAAATGGGLDVTAARPAALRPQPSSALPGVSSAVARFEPLFAAATTKYSLPPGLLAAVAQTESGGNPSAVSPAGALGLMQIMPGTARELGVDPRVPAQAVDGAARLLSQHLRTFGSLDLALAAYNAGPGAVRKHDGIPPYPETQNYVRKVNALLDRKVG